MQKDQPSRAIRLYDLGDVINPLPLDQMKDLFRRNRIAHGKSMNVSTFALERSWESFVKRWNRGDMESAIESREARHRAHSLAYLRDEVCNFCRWNDYPCFVDVEEGCWCNNAQTTRREWEEGIDERPLEGDNLQLIWNYERALGNARPANRRPTLTRSRERDRARPARVSNVVPMYPHREDNQAIERGNSGASSVRVTSPSRRDDRRSVQQSIVVDPPHRQSAVASSVETVDDPVDSTRRSSDHSTAIASDASYRTPPRVSAEVPSRSPVTGDGSIFHTPLRGVVEAPPLQSPGHVDGDVQAPDVDVAEQVPPLTSRANLRCLDLVVREQDQLKDQLNDTDRSVEGVQDEVAELRHKYVQLQNQVQSILTQNRQLREQLGVTLDAPSSKRPRQRYDRPPQ